MRSTLNWALIFTIIAIGAGIACTNIPPSANTQWPQKNSFHYYEGDIHYVIFHAPSGLCVVNYTQDSLNYTMMTDAFPEENPDLKPDTTIYHGR